MRSEAARVPSVSSVGSTLSNQTHALKDGTPWNRTSVASHLWTLRSPPPLIQWWEESDLRTCTRQRSASSCCFSRSLPDSESWIVQAIVVYPEFMVVDIIMDSRDVVVGWCFWDDRVGSKVQVSSLSWCSELGERRVKGIIKRHVMSPVLNTTTRLMKVREGWAAQKSMAFNHKEWIRETELDVKLGE